MTGRTLRGTAERLRVPGPNRMKTLPRCGMGPCQGRLCGLTVTEAIAAPRVIPPAEVGTYPLRTPVRPVTAAELAGLPSSGADRRAVER